MRLIARSFKPVERCQKARETLAIGNARPASLGTIVILPSSTPKITSLLAAMPASLAQIARDGHLAFAGHAHGNILKSYL